MRFLAAIALLLAPAQALASCEGLLSVHSRELAFTYVQATSNDAEAWTPDYRRQYHRSLAHALAVAQRAFEYARMHTCEGGIPPRTQVILLPHGRLAPADLDDTDAVSLARVGASADFDSICVLWTIEIGRFRTEESAILRAQDNGTVYEDSAGYDRSVDAGIHYESCAGTWQPGSFVVRRSGVAPWSVRRGLYLTREDAERAAKAWGPRARVNRQRVDGAVLEQALAEPFEGC